MAVTKAESIEEINDKFLMCRAKGHHWEHVTDKVLVSTRGTPREVLRYWRCRCTTDMTEVIAVPSFEVRSRKYDYPDGYLLAPQEDGSRRINIRDVRREQMVRLGIVSHRIRRMVD